MSNKFSVFTTLFCAVLFQYSIASAVPGMINFQGRLTNGAAAVADGDYRMEFVLFDAMEEGSALWSEVQNVNVKNGIYTVQLGASTPLDVADFDPEEVYLEISICPPGIDISCDIDEMERLSPRLPVTATAFSFKAEEAESASDADLLDGHDSTDFVLKNELAAVNTVMLADGVVSAAKIGTAAVGNSALANLSITESKIDNDAVTADKIADGAVTGDKLAGKSVTSEHLTNGAVTGDKLADGAVTSAKIGVAAVNSAALAGLSVTESKIGNNAVTTAKLADGAVTSAKISGGSGSGLDADLLDGQHASDIIEAASDEVRMPISGCGQVITSSGGSGSYYLTSNLTCTGHGIKIYASNVTVDLNGFTLTGDGDSIDSGIYIYGYNTYPVSNIEIRNGTIRNFGNGIHTSTSYTSDIRIRDVRVLNNSQNGLYVPALGTLVENCLVDSNGGDYGILAGNYATIINNSIRFNSGWGIFVSWHCLISGNTIISNNQSEDSSSGGLRVYGGNYVKNNLVRLNNTRNIYVYNTDNVIEENVLTYSSGYGLYFVSGGNFYANNRASGNTSGNYYGTSSQTDGGGNYSF